MSTEEHEELKTRIIHVLSNYGSWIWNDPAKVFVLVWKHEIKSMMEMDPELLSAEGFLNGMWRDMVTKPEDIHKVFKELQLINGNQKSLTLNMENAQPQRVGILAHLKSGKTLTGLQAWKLYGCYRLSQVIKRLKIAGHHIECNIVSGERYGEYKLIKS